MKKPFDSSQEMQPTFEAPPPSEPPEKSKRFMPRPDENSKSAEMMEALAASKLEPLSQDARKYEAPLSPGELQEISDGFGKEIAELRNELDTVICPVHETVPPQNKS